jgi:signal transduction histidine kinase
LANHYASSYKRLELLNQGLEKMVLDRTTQLSTVNRVKDRLLSIVTHDIRSPLNSLRGTLNIFNEGYISPEEFRKNSRVIEEDLNKTGLLIENILN